MTESLCNHVRTQLAAYKAPREVEYVEDFVMTSSGKINRRILREAEEKLAQVNPVPTGDAK